METLRIKCPSCGIILEVKNSKNEAVKRIVCPHCKKQLAVTFADVLYSQDGIELKVVRVADGGDKYILRIVDSDKVVALNGEILHFGDEVGLIHGDKIMVGQSEFVFNSGKLESYTSTPKPEESTTVQQEKTGKSTQKRRSYFLIWVVMIALIVGGILTWRFLNPQSQILPKAVDVDSIDVVLDTTTHKVVDKPLSTKKTHPTIKKGQKELPSPKVKTSSEENDDFNLELRASKGDVNAQYQLGKRWVVSSDCPNVIKGVKYLEEAARKGHSGAQYALGIIYEKGSPACGINRNHSLSRLYMQQAAEKGNAKAIKYLNSNIE